MYSEKNLATLKKYGISPTDPFVPGICCPGEAPFGESNACMSLCFGDSGIVGFHKLPCPCGHQKPITDFMTNMTIKSIRDGIAGI